MLLGALARLWAVTGRPQLALQLQQEAARGFFERQAIDSASYPLSEWYRLAGALGNRDAFAQAEEMRDRVEGRGGLGFDGNAYVTLSRARACVALGNADGAIEEALADLRARSLIHGHIRCSAARWLAALHDLRREATAAAGVRSELGEAAHAEAARARATRAKATHDLVTTARVNAALSELDRALSAGDSLGAAVALTRLRHLERGLLANLSSVVSRKGLPAYVARFYPY
jgi:hypothetical protein